MASDRPAEFERPATTLRADEAGAQADPVLAGEAGRAWCERAKARTEEAARPVGLELGERGQLAALGPVGLGPKRLLARRAGGKAQASRDAEGDAVGTGLFERHTRVDLEGGEAEPGEGFLLGGVEGVGDPHLEGQGRFPSPSDEDIHAQFPGLSLAAGAVALPGKVARGEPVALRAARLQTDRGLSEEGSPAQLEEPLLHLQVKGRLGVRVGAGRAGPVGEVARPHAAEACHHQFAATDAPEGGSLVPRFGVE